MRRIDNNAMKILNSKYIYMIYIHDICKFLSKIRE